MKKSLTTKKTNKHKRVFLLLLSIIIIAIAITISHSQKNQKSIKNETLLLSVLSEGEQVIIGNSNAPKSLIIFYDYNCHNCSRFFKTTLPLIEKEYINKNKLNIILKPVNLTHNKTTSQAYQLLSCLNHIGSFNELHEILLIDPDFIHTSDFQTFTNTLIQENDEIAECMNTIESDYQTTKNKIQLHKLGYNAVPVFILGNTAYKGSIDITTIHNSFKR